MLCPAASALIPARPSIRKEVKRARNKKATQSVRQAKNNFNRVEGRALFVLPIMILNSRNNEKLLGVRKNVRTI
jgi:hypothetical protein